MTTEEAKNEAATIIAGNGVSTRNTVLALTDPEVLYAVIRAERAKTNRIIVLAAAKSRLRALKQPEEPPILAPAEKPPKARKAPAPKAVKPPKAPRVPAPSGAEITSGRCSLCGKTASTHAEVETVFGFRAMQTKAGAVSRRQPRCKPCRTGKLGRKRE